MAIVNYKKDNLLFKICSLVGVIFILCIFAQSAFAANNSSILKEDTSSKIDVRTFSTTQLSKYKSSPDFQYVRTKPEVLTWWGRFRQWLLQKIFDLIHFGTDTNLGKTILILLAIAFIIYAAYKMIGADKTGLWAKKNTESDFVDLSDENIHAIDFDKLISEAAGENNYRLAIRLWYLKTLKNLSGKNFINWKPGKTNYEYVSDLRETPYQLPFKRLTNNFEYSWYGEGVVSGNDYDILKEQFISFNQQIH